MAEEPIRVETTHGGAVLRVTLQRPEVHNAFDARTIELLAEVFTDAAAAEVRCVLLRGDGRSFSAGADLRWMKESAGLPLEDNARGAKRMADMLQAVDRCPRPVVCRVQGAALGGGTGLVAACDIAVASSGARFGFSEVRLGLIPAVISPFLLRRIGPAQARYRMLTGERFDAETARAIGLVDEVCAPEALDETVERILGALLQGGPDAQAAIKRLVRGVWARSPEEVSWWTARGIAEARAGAEGSEGVLAFLEKRRPSWVHKG